MADEFGQMIEGLHLAGDTIVSTDSHIAVFGEKTSDNTYQYLQLDDSGQLKVVASAPASEYVDDSAFTVETDTGVAIGGVFTTDTIDSGDFGVLKLNANRELFITATDLDIRDLSASQDNVAVSDGTNTLAVNADGSINVNTSGAGSDNTYHYGSANLVKDTATTVESQAPSADENYKALMVSGAGLCEWAVKFGTTGSESVIMQFWTTPSNPTKYVDIPDSITVSSGETILIEATNREKPASPASDFTGHATLIKQT